MKKKLKSKCPSRRCLQVADQIRDELSRLVRLSVKNPDVPSLTITHVLLAPDFLSAKVFFVPLGGCSNNDSRCEDVRSILDSYSGFLRAQLYRNLRIKNAPMLAFVYDDLFDKADRMSVLINHAMSLCTDD